MFKKLFLALSVTALLAFPVLSIVGLWSLDAEAQNTTCSDRPAGDISNACANTRFVHNNGGGGGTPGGTSGQIQYNNSGSFGGFTMSGDCTIVVATGIITCSAGGGSAVVGAILPWTGATVPNNYLLAYGQAIVRASYPQLFTSLVYTQLIFCTSGTATVAATVDISNRLPVGAPIEASACFNAGTTVLSKSGTTITASTNAIASTTTSASFFPWGNGNGTTTFNVPNLMGRALIGRDNMSGSIAGTLTSTYYGVNPDALGALGGSQQRGLATINLPAYTPTGSVGITDPGHTHTNNSFAGINPPVAGSANDGPNAIYQGNVTINAAVTGISAAFTGNAQGGTATPFSVVNPMATIDWIIKALPDSGLRNNNITVGVTTITSGSNTNIIYNNNGVVGEYALATVPDMYAGTSATKLVTPSVVWPPEVTVTYGTTTTFDMSTFRDAKVTLTGNITTMTISNVVVGKSGTVTFIQDGTGSRTTVWSSTFKFAGGVTPTLTTTANAIDILSFSCRTSSFCFAAMMNDVK